METRWMTRREAATYLRVTTHTIDRYARAGLLTRYRIAGTKTPRYRKEDLDALLNRSDDGSPVQQAG